MRAKPAKRKALSPDSRYNSLEVTKLINRSMKNGKKAAARHEIYAALELLAQKTKEKPLDILLAALNYSVIFFRVIGVPPILHFYSLASRICQPTQ